MVVTTFDDLKVDDINVVDKNTQDNNQTDGLVEDQGTDATSAEPKKDDNSSGADAANTSAQDKPVLKEPVIDPPVAFEDLTEETGVEVGSKEDLVTSLKELNGYRSGNIPGLSPALKKAFEIEKSGGNVSDYFRALSLDEDKMSDQEVLKHAYLEKSALSKTNPKLAGMEFTKEFKSAYSAYLHYQSLNDEVAKAEFLEKNADEIEYQKEKYQHDVAQARQSVKDLKNNFPTTAQSGMTQAEIDKVILEHDNAVTQKLSSFKAVDLKIEGDEVFAIGLNAKTKPVVEEWLHDPQTFLEAIGMHAGKKIDLDTYTKVCVAIANFSEDDFGARFKKQILDNKDVKTLENDLTGAANISRGNSAEASKGDLWDQLGKEFEVKRSSRAL